MVCNLEILVSLGPRERYSDHQHKVTTCLRSEPFLNLFRMFLISPMLASNNIRSRNLRVHFLIFNSDDSDIIDIMVFEKFAFEFCWRNL